MYAYTQKFAGSSKMDVDCTRDWARSDLINYSKMKWGWRNARQVRYSRTKSIICIFTGLGIIIIVNCLGYSTRQDVTSEPKSILMIFYFSKNRSKAWIVIIKFA